MGLLARGLSLNLRWLALVGVWGASGCAAPAELRRGDALVAAGDYSEAVVAYERALRESPGSDAAAQGLRRARREAVRAELRHAQRALSKGEYQGALSHLRRANQMPLDLEAVSLLQELDDTLNRAAQGAEEQTEKWLREGLVIWAALLAEQVLDTCGHVESRRAWGRGILAEASRELVRRAEELEAAGYLGGATLFWAMAKRAGGDVSAARVQDTWERFAEGICFAPPVVRVVDNEGSPPEGAEGGLRESVRAGLGVAVQEALHRATGGCGAGQAPLEVELRLETLEVVDEVRTEEVVQPLPGSGIKTQEIYYEERPYTAWEDVIELEKKIETVERRDCAPRPGQPRGCRTWLEEVAVEVPVTRRREVQKIRRIQRTRPLPGPFPPDRVVAYPRQVATRRVRVEGTLTLGAPFQSTTVLNVWTESSDLGHEGVSHPRLSLPPDPLEVDSLEHLTSTTFHKLRGHTQEILRQGMNRLTDERLARARSLAEEGKGTAAQELALAQVVLGQIGTPLLPPLFRQWYRASPEEVVSVLREAMGYEAASHGDGPPIPRAAGAPLSPPSDAPTPSAAPGDRHGDVQDDVQGDPGGPEADPALRALEEATYEAATPKTAPRELSPPPTSLPSNGSLISPVPSGK